MKKYLPSFPSRFFRTSKEKVGLPPGTLIYAGKKKVEKVRITVIDYDKENFEEKTAKKPEDCFRYKKRNSTTWINVDGLHDVEVIRKLGEGFDLHPLVQEDILNTEQRAKVEDYTDYIYIVVKMLYYDNEEIVTEQVSMILGKNYVLSFQERQGDVFNIIRDRVKGGKWRIRKLGADYLAYALLDAIVDHYFLLLEKVGENVEVLEQQLTENPSREVLHEIHSMKREAIFLRKAVWPLREVISSLLRGESKLVKKGTELYIRDLYDHTIQVIDTVETIRDMLSGMLDLYLSTISNRMNEVMKVLTIFAAIFIPLTFIAGIYGMNFQFMPELQWQWGYFMVWGIIILVALLMLFFFRRKNWL